jgi:hypothetical protein
MMMRTDLALGSRNSEARLSLVPSPSEMSDLLRCRLSRRMANLRIQNSGVRSPWDNAQQCAWRKKGYFHIFPYESPWFLSGIQTRSGRVKREQSGVLFGRFRSSFEGGGAGNRCSKLQPRKRTSLDRLLETLYARGKRGCAQKLAIRILEKDQVTLPEERDQT